MMIRSDSIQLKLSCFRLRPLFSLFRTRWHLTFVWGNFWILEILPRGRSINSSNLLGWKSEILKFLRNLYFCLSGGVTWSKTTSILLLGKFQIWKFCTQGGIMFFKEMIKKRIRQFWLQNEDSCSQRFLNKIFPQKIIKANLQKRWCRW